VALGLHLVEYKSQKDGPYEEIGCGAASLMMLLRHHVLPIRVPSYPQLCECLWLMVDPEIKGWARSNGRGAFTTDVERALRGMKSRNSDQIQFSRIEEADPERALRLITKALKLGPVMSTMKGKGFGAGEGHWIVVTGLQDGGLQCRDPWHNKRRSLSLVEFRKHWDGDAFFLTHPCKCAT
jgi:hypothetical protein